MALIIYRSFDIIVDVGSLEHLGDIERDPVEDRSCLRVGANMLVAGSSDGRGTGHHLSAHENNYQKDDHRHE